MLLAKQLLIKHSPVNVDKTVFSPSVRVAHTFWSSASLRISKLPVAAKPWMQVPAWDPNLMGSVITLQHQTDQLVWLSIPIVPSPLPWHPAWPDAHPCTHCWLTQHLQNHLGSLLDDIYDLFFTAAGVGRSFHYSNCLTWAEILLQFLSGVPSSPTQMHTHIHT